MANQGRPIPTTTYQSYRAKVSDGKSVGVTVPENTEIEAQRFYELDGFFGAAFHSLTTGAGQTGDVGLNIEQAEYETDQIDTTKAIVAGDAVYWDSAAKKITTTKTDNRLIGRVTQGKDQNNVIWFILGPQV